LKQYIKRYRIYTRTRDKADKVLMPDELAEVDKMLNAMAENSAKSQKTLDKMISESAPAKEILRRNVSALERAIEAMNQVTAALTARIEQVKRQKHRTETVKKSRRHPPDPGKRLGQR